MEPPDPLDRPSGIRRMQFMRSHETESEGPHKTGVRNRLVLGSNKGRGGGRQAQHLGGGVVGAIPRQAAVSLNTT